MLLIFSSLSILLRHWSSVMECLWLSPGHRPMSNKSRHASFRVESYWFVSRHVGVCDTCKRCPCILYISTLTSLQIAWMICLGLLMRNYFFMLYISIKQADLQLAYFSVYKTNNKKPNTPMYTHPYPQTVQKRTFFRADSFSLRRSNRDGPINCNRFKSYLRVCNARPPSFPLPELTLQCC